LFFSLYFKRRHAAAAADEQTPFVQLIRFVDNFYLPLVKQQFFVDPAVFTN